MSLLTALAAAAGPIALRVLTALGFTAMTFAGVQSAVNALIVYAQNAWATQGAAAIQIASLAGFPEAIGLVCGAFVARTTLWVTAKAVRLIFTGAA